MRATLLPLLLTLALSGCSRRAAPAEAAPEPPPAAEPSATATAEAAPARYAGFYEAGWERSVFRPCGVQEEWWAWSTGRIIQDDSRGWGRVYVVVRGTVSERGRFGHLGRYPRQIAIAEVLEVRPAQGATCPATVRRDASPAPTRG